MLYHLHELQRRFLNPLSVWAQATSELFTSPYSPLAYTPVSRRLAAGYDLLHRVGKYYEKPEFGLRTTAVNGKEVPIVEETLESRPFCRLLHFKRVWPNGMGKRPADPKVLIVAPLSASLPSAVTPTTVPFAAFSATVLAATLLSATRTGLSLTLDRLIVKFAVPTLPSDEVACTVMVWLVALS